MSQTHTHSIPKLYYTRMVAQVSKLEEMHRALAEDIVSYIQSEPVLSQASHAQMLEHNADWGISLGLGYVGAQKKGLIYKHLSKLLEHVRAITSGDPMKAKGLSEMLYLRMHAGFGQQNI